jgi:hypothetical protein
LRISGKEKKLKDKSLKAKVKGLKLAKPIGDKFYCRQFQLTENK